MYEGEHLISSMPLRELVEQIEPRLPAPAVIAAKSLKYRDFLTVGLIVREDSRITDNWIYIHDPSVKVGRIQNYKSWSPEMVPDPERLRALPELRRQYSVHRGRSPVHQKSGLRDHSTTPRRFRWPASRCFRSRRSRIYIEDNWDRVAAKSPCWSSARLRTGADTFSGRSAIRKRQSVLVGVASVRTSRRPSALAASDCPTRTPSAGPWLSVARPHREPQSRVPALPAAKLLAAP